MTLSPSGASQWAEPPHKQASQPWEGTGGRGPSQYSLIIFFRRLTVAVSRKRCTSCRNRGPKSPSTAISSLWSLLLVVLRGCAYYLSHLSCHVVLSRVVVSSLNLSLSSLEEVSWLSQLPQQRKGCSWHYAQTNLIAGQVRYCSGGRHEVPIYRVAANSLCAAIRARRGMLFRGLLG